MLSMLGWAPRLRMIEPAPVASTSSARRVCAGGRWDAASGALPLLCHARPAPRGGRKVRNQKRLRGQRLWREEQLRLGQNPNPRTHKGGDNYKVRHARLLQCEGRSDSLRSLSDRGWLHAGRANGDPNPSRGGGHGVLRRGVGWRWTRTRSVAGAAGRIGLRSDWRGWTRRGARRAHALLRCRGLVADGARTV